jgi:TonB family protein
MPGTAQHGLFAGPAPRRRSWSAIATSASLHVSALIGIALLARSAAAPQLPRDRRPLTFVSLASLPVPHEPMPALTLAASPALAPPAAEQPSPVEIPKPDAPAPAPEPLARPTPVPAAPEPPRPAPPAIAPAAPPPVPTPAPAVNVGLFADSARPVREDASARVVRDAGFDGPAPIAKADTRSAAVTGAFDPAASGEPAKSARQAVVASAGFGSGRADAAANPRPAAEVHTSGFDAVRPTTPRAARAVPAPERVEVPVEIVFKPTPVYTEEARRLKLEGDVLLDVEFAATGAVSVLQVVRGLGHGLDEAATTAAMQIRFKPAQASGRPISFRTTVHIVFRLA